MPPARFAIAYTCSTLQGLKIKQLGQQKYINRLQEVQRTQRRHSNFWIGQYGLLWTIAMEFWSDLAEQLMRNKCNKLPFFQRGKAALTLIQSSLYSASRWHSYKFKLGKHTAKKRGILWLTHRVKTCAYVLLS